MKQPLKKALTFLFVLVFTTNAYSLLELFFPAIKEMYWYALLFVCSVFFILVNPNKFLTNLPKRVVLWVSLYTLGTMLAYLVSSQSEVVELAIIIQIKALSVFLGFFVLMTDKSIIKVALYALVVTIIIGSVINILEFFNIVNVFSDARVWGVDDSNRSAGMYMNANYSGFTLTFSLIFASLITPKKWLWPLIILTLFGVFFTYSRTSWGLLFLVIIALPIVRANMGEERFSIMNLKTSAVLSLFFSSAVAATFIYLIFSGIAVELVKGSQHEDLFSADALSRLEGSFDDGSTNERKVLIDVALNVSQEKPIVGKGAAYTFEWKERVAPHNEWLMTFTERGIIGLIIYSLFYVFMWLKAGRHGKLFVIMFAISALSSHNGLELPSTYIFAALVYLIKDEDYIFS